MEITLVAAMDQRCLIGRSAGGIPWHLPADAAHFRSYCHGKVVVVGRRTFEEMDGWFERVGAMPLVLTSRGTDRPVASITEANEVIAAARKLDPPESGEIVVAGGARTYAALLPMATRMVLSEIHACFEGDLFFPAFDKHEWTVLATRRHEAVPGDPDRQYAFSITERIRK